VSVRKLLPICAANLIFLKYKSDENYSENKESVQNHRGKDNLEEWSGIITFRLGLGKYNTMVRSRWKLV
jgi:hypothetical protein